MIINRLSTATSEAVFELYNAKTDPETIAVQETSEHFEGDFTIVLFPFLRLSKKGPEETGREVGNYLISNCEEVESYQIVKGYLNISLKDSFWVSFIKQGLTTLNFGFKALAAEKAPVLVEFSSPNTNKPLHLGHIRNNLIGSAVSSILEANGDKVIRVNLVNDRGIHICKSMLGWLKFGKGKTPEITGIKGDKFVGDYYVAFDKAYREELAGAVAAGSSEEEAEKNSAIMNEARAMLRHWEDGEVETRALWNQMNSWVYDGFDVTYQRLGIHFDRTYHESETYMRGREMVLEGLQNKVLEQRPDGSVWVDLQDVGMDQKLLLRSDGTSVYITQDIGTAMIREEEFEPGAMIYVVGNEQNYHFEVLVRVLEKLKFRFAEKIRHLSYGMVELPSGKMKSREGKVVDADDLMDEMHQTAGKVTAELGKWSEEQLSELDDLFEMVGQGALKYFILKVDPKKNMLFNPEESIDFNGNTGPFIQYTHARIASLIRKSEEQKLKTDIDTVTEQYSIDQQERLVIKTLYRWPTVLEDAAKELNPALVANYCYDLAKGFNQFYQALSVLSADDAEKIGFRIGLTALTGQVLRNAMGLLGIRMPEKM